MLKKILLSLGVMSVCATLFANTASAVTHRPVIVTKWNTVERGRCGMMVKYYPTQPDPKVVKVNVYWRSNVNGGWHILDWGDGSTTGISKFRGARMYRHNMFGSGTKNITFTTDMVDGNEPSCVVTVPVTFN